MKQIFILITSATLLSGCSNINRILSIDDDFKNEKSIRLIQELESYSDEKRSRLLSPDYILTLKTLYTKPQNLEGKVTAELTLKTEARPEKLDSIIFIETDGEKFQFISSEYAARHFVNRSVSTSTTTSVEKKKDEENDDDTEKTSTTTETTTTDHPLQIMKRTIEIPRDLWEQFSQAEQIRLRFYIDNEGVTVRFSSRYRKKFTELFKTIPQFKTGSDNS
jgi:hypothetical protein